jgi:sulfite reductase beta subunit-like hemoprotein
MSSPKIPLTQEAKNEISRFKSEIAGLAAGTTNPDLFKRFRLNNGIYGIRFKDDEHMIRIKIPYGVFTADQLDVIADAAADLTPSQLSHVTTRQAIQLHNIKRKDVPELLQRIHDAGLTSREACGNTVRNVTCDELVGIHPDEVFDVRPYADLIFRYFLRNPISQNLPRKFKIAFESDPNSDRARTGIHDIGFRATKRVVNGKTEYGFITVVGGGLGAMPFAAHDLEDFTPVDDILPTAEAIVRLFDRNGDRRDKNRARLKFVIHRWGFEEFKKQFLAERDVVRATSSGNYEKFHIEPIEEKAPAITGQLLKDVPVDPGYDAWMKTNVIQQKQKGYNAVYVRCLYGDLTPSEAHGLASVARDYAGGRLRTTITQNVLIAWVADAALKTVYSKLNKLGIALDNAQKLADITRCPGADTCNLAITHSKGLARDLTEKIFSNGLAHDKELENISIKISGCTNSCGQHHIGNIGFFGASRNVDGKQLPHYQMLVGGKTGFGHDAVKFGQRVAFIPARRISEAVKHLLETYKKNKQSNETFVSWTERQGLDFLKNEMQPFTDTDPLKSDAENMYKDLGDSEGTQFKVAVGKGECAA